MTNVEDLIQIKEDLNQDQNDLIMVFCGGKLENIPYIGEVYRFDDSKILEELMKCPPFGFLLRRDNENGPRTMEYHTNYNWLMFAIKNCWEKLQQIKTPDFFLKEKYKEICKSLTDFLPGNNTIGTRRMELQWTFDRVVEFIEIYNKNNYENR